VQIRQLSLTLDPKEAASFVYSLPLPQGVEILDLYFTDKGLDAVVKASVAFNIPIKFKIEVWSFAGSKINLKVSPPVKSSWFSVFRPLVVSMPGLAYVGHSIIELDLVSFSKGSLTSLTIEKLTVNKTGFHIQVADVDCKIDWGDFLSLTLKA
jgi:hypothetical protein